MYGDCQVLPAAVVSAGAGGGNAVSSDSIFSSAIRSPNLSPFAGFMNSFHSALQVRGRAALFCFPFFLLSGMKLKVSAFVGLQKKESTPAAGTRKEEEMESGSGSGEENDDGTPPPPTASEAATAPQNPPPGKKKRYHRHTARQIQEMEALFKENQHPDDKHRLRLSQDLGLKPRQVKFWFQNRRTQMKVRTCASCFLHVEGFALCVPRPLISPVVCGGPQAQQDRADNVLLRAENDNLKNENYRLQAAIRNVVCPNCGGPAMIGELSFDEHHLRVENARLKEELDRLSCIAGRYSGRLMPPPPPLGMSPALMLPAAVDLEMGVYPRQFPGTPPFPQLPGIGDCGEILLSAAGLAHGDHLAGVLVPEPKKRLALELAMTAADQLATLCRMNEPLWQPISGVAGAGACGGQVEFLDKAEHGRLLPWPVDLQPLGGAGEFITEGTRDSTLVIMNSITLLDAFMDSNKWVELFPSIISKARMIQVISSGLSGHGSGSLLLMYAEFQVLSPLVPTREAYFLRYCLRNVEEGTCTIVDFPIDNLLQDGIQMPLTSYRRRPSGCLIQDMPNGYSRVIWVEHAEVEDKPVHQIFNQLVNSGMAFGASCWLSNLQRQCERLASMMARNISDLGVIPTPEARKNMMKLSQRMVKTFCSNITSSGGLSWTALSDSPDDTIRVTTRKNTLPGQPNGVILSAVSTTWLPFSYHQVFDLLTDENRRSQLDSLSSGNSLHEVAHIANGSHPRNCVSLLRIKTRMKMRQQCCQYALLMASRALEPKLAVSLSFTHSSGGSLIVYATVAVDAIQVAISGEDSSYIPLLPTGFVLFPSTSSCSPATGELRAPTGCLLTVGMQVLASAVPSAKLNLSSITAINHHLCTAVHQITAALAGQLPENLT
ncbi:Homeobox-leucine zipper protein ROC3 [Apostasia shenzhenica]|uniref:Homeobox-leucine zipper protein ROC3 n=1 Tax=Apostasia shenzhenica TaxID=1088818 RepID=A0A2I0AJK1_9ASPA|nr:Homeobox-leucine zipper protein ROC3 [Apostasia shenzhenica]